MLEFRNLTVTYDREPVLRDVSFSLAPGKLTVLLGRNGGGKSTLTAALNQEIPYEGHILLDGVDLAKLSPKDRAVRIAYLPQNMPAPHLTVEELVALGRSPAVGLLGRRSQEDQELIENAIGQAGVRELQGRYVDTLSGGERQLVYLAMILAQNTDIIVLDEPTAHLDPSRESGFLRLLEELKGEKTVLLILHDLSQAVAFGDQLAVLDENRLVFFGSKEALLDSNVLEETFSVEKFTAGESGKVKHFFAAF